jgi:monoterpene epsilon-lactone hydrolase
MPSLRARLVNLALPLLGIKSFFSEPALLDERIAKLRRKKRVRPRGKWHKRFDITEFTSRGFPVITIEPRGGAKPGAPHLFYLQELGASATVPIYPLAPELTAKQTLPAMRSLYGELAERYGAKNTTIMGDSAGGGMTLALAQQLAADGGDMPGCLVLFSPWLDATAKGDGQASIEPNDRMLAISGLEACGRRYAGDLELEDPRVSPLFGELDGLAPMAIFAGTSDILLVDARRLVEKLQALGVNNFLYREYKDMFHVWMLLPVPEGKKARAETIDFIRLHHSHEAA